ncbi:DUF389 domain-containing protein [uncultured Winogradskyella sp.]|uniref:DUF389 domain-containing protein n=1 Tax=uncultured Winogradskyella sp. TaxID=395353 RepID=UPI00261D3106|nr:DUF389 domain-containing protein [uncultured Winogradskyella sp.]
MEESKFNFSDEDQSQKTNEMNKEAAVEEKKQAVKKDAQGLFASISTFLSELLDFRDDTDRDATIAAIKADISFKGATAWILVCSIMVASVGLNADSTAVVIGAMLISPLMGPILGIGMSIALNDIDTLKKSLINLAIMIVLSLLTAFLFFRIFPTAEIITGELAGRTKPDIRDVLIAFFGGLALIIARTKKGTIASVIFGVAIATALMPPLCTAGYGLANGVRGIEGGFDNFLGAMNLFTINTIFIALATFIVLKLLRFPMLKYANSKKRRRIAQLASLIAIIVMIWPTVSFVNFITDTRVKADFNAFIKNDINSNPNLWYQERDEDLDAVHKIINLHFNGDVSDEMISALENNKKKYKNIKDFELIINANKTRSADMLNASLNRAYADLDQKDIVIKSLQDQISKLELKVTDLNKVLESNATDNNNNSVSFTMLSKDVKIRFNELEAFGYAKFLESKDFVTIDTVDVANVRWKLDLNDSLVLDREKKLQLWLKNELKVDTVYIRRH